MPAMAGRQALCLERRRLTPYPTHLFYGTGPGWGLFEVSLPRLMRKEGCRMTLTEILALVAVLISLLTLIATVVHDTFDIAWKIAEHRNTNEKKK